jgi:tetratricopeptide (TPR) repeat protein
MRSLLVAGFLLVAGCGSRPASSTLPSTNPTVVPAADLGAARGSALRDPGDGHLVSKDPRIVDLDIIRITATTRGVGGDPHTDHVATGDLFKEANAAAKAGETERAIGIYRRLVTEFPDSGYAPTSLFNIAAIYDGRRDLPATIAVLRELVKAYPTTRESIEGHLYIAALHTDHSQYPAALSTLDEVLARTNLTYADRIEAFARRGYVLIELRRHEEAEVALDAAIADFRKVTALEDTYYIAMASYYRGELAHRRFTDAPVRLPDDQLIADLEAKRVHAVKAYDYWRLRLLAREPAVQASLLGDRLGLSDVADLRRAVGGPRQGAIPQAHRDGRPPDLRARGPRSRTRAPREGPRGSPHERRARQSLRGRDRVEPRERRASGEGHGAARPRGQWCSHHAGRLRPRTYTAAEADCPRDSRPGDIVGLA